MQQPTSTSTLTFTPDQIRRRLRDYDAQVRLGIEDGSVRQVMRTIFPDLLHLFNHQQGSPAQAAAFPRRLFLFKFLGDWNETAKRHSPDFIDNQVASMAGFDARYGNSGLSGGPVPVAVPHVPLTVPIPIPVPGPTPSHSPAPSPSPAPAPVPVPAASRPPPRARPIAKPATVPPPASIDPPSPAPVPEAPKPNPRAKRTTGQAVVAPRPTVHDSESGSDPDIDYYDPPCKHCLKAKKVRVCERDGTGGACVPCKKLKYKCEYANTKPQVDDDVVEVEDGPSKGKKKTAGQTRTRAKKRNRAAESDGDEVEAGQPLKGKGKKRAASGAARVKSEKEPPAKSGQTKGKKGKVQVDVESRGAGGMDGNEEDEDAEGEDDSEADEPKVKRARVRIGPPREANAERKRTEARLVALEEQVAGLSQGMQQSAPMEARLNAIEGQVHRVTGALETFLGRITIDDRLRLVPDTRRIERASHSPSQPPTPQLAIIEDDPIMADSSPHIPLTFPHASTSPSDFAADVRMEDITHPPVPEPASTPLAVDPDQEMAPPPAVRLVPPSPHTSNVHSVADPEPVLDSLPDSQPSEVRPITMHELRLKYPGPGTRARSRSRTPL